MMQPNCDIRLYAYKCNVKMYQIAEKLGMHYATLNSKLRKELKEEEKQKIIKIIDELKEGGKCNG